MPEVHIYVTARDKAFIAQLPPDVTLASILRSALDTYRGCEHDQASWRCLSCGMPVEGPARPAAHPDDLAIGPTPDVEVLSS